MNDIVAILLAIALLAGSGYHFYQRSKNILNEVTQNYWIWTQLITIGLLLLIGSQFARNIWHYLLIGSAILYFISGPLARGLSESYFSVFLGTFSIMKTIPFAKVERVVLTREPSKHRINLLGRADKQYFVQSYTQEDETRLVAHLKQSNIKVDYNLEPQK